MAHLELTGLEKGKLNIAKEQLSDFNFDCSKIPPGCECFRLISAFCCLLQPPRVPLATAKMVELVQIPGEAQTAGNYSLIVLLNSQNPSTFLQ